MILDRLILHPLPPKILSVAVLCKYFLVVAGTKSPGKKSWFYSIRIPKAP
jgi:hypothetical protein